ncbi:septum site-determining protein MinC [Paenibacillus sp. y28]|uniref:septum site-determining protein MinC n=1 Tax=Paenibacillus sp. y28 TaxID=3129110 RepID=UPI003016224F
MAGSKHRVLIKGVKDGLIFVMDDSCPLEELIGELDHKLEKTHHKLLSGPPMNVKVQLGSRVLTDEERERISESIQKSGNLLIQSIESTSEAEQGALAGQHIQVMRGVVRSGQVVEHEGNVLYLGDVNPGGTIICTGDIYVMGALRGMAHAGSNGNEQAIIAASYMRPTQLRIAGIISRPPDEWGIEEAYMEFAYLDNGTMQIDKMAQLHRFKHKGFVGG